MDFPNKQLFFAETAPTSSPQPFFDTSTFLYFFPRPFFPFAGEMRGGGNSRFVFFPPFRRPWPCVSKTRSRASLAPSFFPLLASLIVLLSLDREKNFIAPEQEKKTQ